MKQSKDNAETIEMALLLRAKDFYFSFTLNVPVLKMPELLAHSVTMCFWDAWQRVLRQIGRVIAIYLHCCGG